MISKKGEGELLLLLLLLLDSYTLFSVPWVEHSKTLREQGVQESEILLLKRKYFYSDANVDARYKSKLVETDTLNLDPDPELWPNLGSGSSVMFSIYIV